MDDLFKKDELRFKIEVTGETDTYYITVRFDDILPEIAEEIKRNKNKLEFKTVFIALARQFNRGDLYLSCECPDFKYRFAYWATKDNYNSGMPEIRPADITNPEDRKGAGCKHINLVLANTDWIYKVASVINNYIWYCKDNMENNYARYIFPKLYGMDYQDAIQMSIFDYDQEGNEIDTLESDEEIINLSNALGKSRTKFKAGNKYRFKKKDLAPEDDEKQVKLQFTNNKEPKIDLEG